MLASPLQIFCFKTECTFHLLCLQSHGHLVSCTRFLSVWVSLSLSPLFLSGMQRWPSGPAHLWEQSAISPRPCSNSKHLASFGRFVDFLSPRIFPLVAVKLIHTLSIRLPPPPTSQSTSVGVGVSRVSALYILLVK